MTSFSAAKLLIYQLRPTLCLLNWLANTFFLTIEMKIFLCRSIFSLPFSLFFSLYPSLCRFLFASSQTSEYCLLQQRMKPVTNMRNNDVGSTWIWRNLDANASYSYRTAYKRPLCIFQGETKKKKKPTLYREFQWMIISKIVRKRTLHDQILEALEFDVA